MTTRYKVATVRLIEAVKPTPEFDEAFELGLTLERMSEP